MFAIRMIHRGSDLVDLHVYGEEVSDAAVNNLQNVNHAAYARLIHYKQCRYPSSSNDVMYFWAMFDKLNWDYISIMTNKELEAYQ